MKQSEIIKRIVEIANQLETGMNMATVKSNAYSADGRSKLAFEVGYLSGLIKDAVIDLNEIESKK